MGQETEAPRCCLMWQWLLRLMNIWSPLPGFLVRLHCLNVLCSRKVHGTPHGMWVEGMSFRVYTLVPWKAFLELSFIVQILSWLKNLSRLFREMLWKKYGQPVLLEEVKHFMLVILGLGQGKTEVFFLFVCLLFNSRPSPFPVLWVCMLWGARLAWV